MLAMLRDRLGSDPRLKLLQLDGQGLGGIADASIDRVFCYDVLVHLQHWDIFHYLREIRRVLRPGGRAIVHTANTLSPLGWRKFEAEVELQRGRAKRPETFTPMTRELEEAFIDRAGLRQVRCITDVVRRDAIWWLERPERPGA